MPISNLVSSHLTREALSLRERLGSVMPFDLHMTSIPAATISVGARRSIDAFVGRGKQDMEMRLSQYLEWLHTAGQSAANDELAQKRFTTVRLHADQMLSRFDLYSDVLTQRSEHRVGVWLAGLEVAATDALEIEGVPNPPVVCYLDRGSGAAIRRARTRLPGGELNPVALVRIPRERMVGSGVGSSLVHEVGHQGMALLDCVRSIRPILAGLESKSDRTWTLWGRWISEILADFWSVARVGPTAVMGMMSVVSMPTAFVFRIAEDDPHPFPWIRVRLACAIANELFPHHQWANIDSLWQRLYPPSGLGTERDDIIRGLSNTRKALARLIAEHRPRRLGGRTLREVLLQTSLSPEDLNAVFENWKDNAAQTIQSRPCQALAVLGQAKLSGHLGAVSETRILEELLTNWALHRTRNEIISCA